MINNEYFFKFFHSETEECIFCEESVSQSELKDCRNKKCTKKVHDNCKTNQGQNLSMCKYCRTCKVCNEVLERVHKKCDQCGGGCHTDCINNLSQQTKNNYTCKVCREQTEQLER